MAPPLRALPSVVTYGATGVILAIDYGRRKLGLALSDERGVTARPFATWMRINRRRDLARLRELARQEGVRQIVVGLALHLDGTPSEMSEEAKSFALRVEKALGIPVEMIDERLSSWEAGELHADTPSMKSRTRTRRNASRQDSQLRQKPLDDIAAAIILRDYLERTHSLPEVRD